MSNSSGILKDHKKKGTKLIPPFPASFPDIRQVPYIDITLPELIWFGTLNMKLGIRGAADLITETVKVLQKNKCEVVVFASSFSELEEFQKNKIIESLRKTSILNNIQNTLNDFIYFYPECPLAFLLEDKKLQLTDKNFIENFKKYLSKLYNKRSSEGIFMQALAVYKMFLSGKLKAASHTSLANFPEVEHYPNTQISKEIAASICCVLNLFCGTCVIDKGLQDWSKYFWNRSRQIEPIDLTKIEW